MRLSFAGGLLLLSMLAACAPPPPPTPLAPKRIHLTNYTVGESRTVTVGEPIFEVQPAFLRSGYVVAREYSPPRIGLLTEKPAPLVRGMEFEVFAMYADSSLLLLNDAYNPGLGIRIRPSGVPAGGWVLRTGEPTNAIPWEQTSFFKKADAPVQRKGDFRAELLYSGITGTTLKATYREFMDGTARPAFYQELQYELGESRIISYKSLRIEVLNATNSRLEYRVIDDGGLPWLP